MGSFQEIVDSLKPNAKNVLTILHPRDYKPEVSSKNEEARSFVKQVRDKYNAAHKAILILETGPPCRGNQQHNITYAFKLHSGWLDSDDCNNNRLTSLCSTFEVNQALLAQDLHTEGLKKNYTIVGCTDKSAGEIAVYGKQWVLLHPELDATDSNCFEYVDSIAEEIIAFITWLCDRWFHYPQISQG